MWNLLILEEYHNQFSFHFTEPVELQSPTISKTEELDQQLAKEQKAPKSQVKQTPSKVTKNEKGVPSPRHVMQQRANTPSSKDGTEVWAQNSHHSDEAGPDWKNGANRR